jgi:hypothetical protein
MGLLDFVSETLKAGIDLTIGVPVGVAKKLRKFDKHFVL